MYWTGGRQLSGSLEPNQGFIWDNSTSPVSNSYWSLSQPDNSGGIEHRVNIWFYVSSGTSLNDLSEGTLLPYICERPLL